MSSPPPHELSQLLQAWSDGDATALERLAPIVEAELRRVAHYYMAGERRGHLLQTTALINEAYVRLIGWNSVHWHNRAHFFAVAARMMRHILVDFSRKRPRLTGGPARLVPLEDALTLARERGADLVALDDVLRALAEQDARKAEIVELRFFGGMSVEETAEALQVAPITVMREWAKAKAWLYRELKRGERP